MDVKAKRKELIAIKSSFLQAVDALNEAHKRMTEANVFLQSKDEVVEEIIPQLTDWLQAVQMGLESLGTVEIAEKK